MAINDTTSASRPGSRGASSLNRVLKISELRERLRGPCVITAAGLPPAPLTGDVGRGCGDASRALLFCSGFNSLVSYLFFLYFSVRHTGKPWENRLLAFRPGAEQ
jgi:hypothetical protein